jgi:glycosyltransferase involved in cell wall biosynthesis
MMRPVDTSNPYFMDAAYYSSLFDFTMEEIRLSQAAVKSRPVSTSSRMRTALWIIPHFTYPFFAGIHTVFRFADYLEREHGIQNSFAILGVEEITFQPNLIRSAFPTLRRSHFYAVTNEQLSMSHIPNHDIGICTAWQTAFPLLKFNRLKLKFYFMQDYEPDFYPAGTIHSLAASTYRFGFTAICNSPDMSKIYKQQGKQVFDFKPSIDKHIFHPPSEPRPDDNRPLRLLFNARPFAMRSAFELGVHSVWKAKLLLGDKITIVCVGGGWDPSNYGLQGAEFHDQLTPPELGRLYRSCDIAMSLMMTPHASYTTIELMASGCLVVTSQSPYRDWIIKDRINCLVAMPSPSCLAEAITEAVLDSNLRRSISKRAALDVQSIPDWNDQFKPIAKYMLQGG